MTELKTDIYNRRATDRQIKPAQRIMRLPPYLFGKLNALKLGPKTRQTTGGHRHH